MALQHLLLYAIPLFLVSMWIEFKLSDEGDHAGYTRKDFISNMNIGMVAILFGLVASSFSISLYVACFNYFVPWRIRFLGYESMGWGIGAWLACILADDFTYYWFHRTSHRIRVLWACHIVHHSSEHYNFSTSIRNGGSPCYINRFIGAGWRPLAFIRYSSSRALPWIHSTSFSAIQHCCPDGIGPQAY